jgi:dTDP-4-dehydrorhamnose 3,5-epimerase
MAFECESTDIPGVLVFHPPVFRDPRGFFMETYHLQRYADAGLDACFVQDNYSHSCGGVLRGLHYQFPRVQGKLVSVVWGEIFDVAVDLRVGSPTFGRWVGEVLSDQNRCQLWIPEGFAHGFCVLSDKADVVYKCTGYYVASDDRGVLWSDPAIGIQWPRTAPLLSAKDGALLPLAAIPREHLPTYGESQRAP